MATQPEIIILKRAILIFLIGLDMASRRGRGGGGGGWWTAGQLLRQSVDPTGNRNRIGA